MTNGLEDGGVCADVPAMAAPVSVHGARAGGLCRVGGRPAHHVAVSCAVVGRGHGVFDCPAVRGDVGAAGERVCDPVARVETRPFAVAGGTVRRAALTSSEADAGFAWWTLAPVVGLLLLA